MDDIPVPIPVCFLPYGAYVTSCGRIEDRRHPNHYTMFRRVVTCSECQAQIINFGDLPPIVPRSK